MARFAQVRFGWSLEERVACVREPTGHDEESIEGRSTLAAIRYLDRLLVDAPGVTVRAGAAGTLTAPERDALLAAIHRLVLGDRVEGSPRCEACRERFDLNFELGAFEANAHADRRLPTPEERRDGAFHGPSGLRFRLPTGDEECGVVGLPAREAAARLAAACISSGHASAEVLSESMRAVAPVLDEDIVARCPNCAHAMTVRFDIQTFHLGAMERLRGVLPHEVDRLARAYGWGLNEVLALPRSRRQAYVAVATGEQRTLGAGR